MRCHLDGDSCLFTFSGSNHHIKEHRRIYETVTCDLWYENYTNKENTIKYIFWTYNFPQQ